MFRKRYKWFLSCRKNQHRRKITHSSIDRTNKNCKIVKQRSPLHSVILFKTFGVFFFFFFFFIGFELMTSNSIVHALTYINVSQKMSNI